MWKRRYQIQITQKIGIERGNTLKNEGLQIKENKLFPKTSMRAGSMN